MPDGSPLGYTGSPNDTNPSATSETGDYLLNNAPPMTMYLDTDSDLIWRRTMVSTWVELGSGGDGGSEFHKYFKYDADLDKLVASKPITTTLNSFYLGNHHKISSGGQNVFFTNLSTDIHFYPMWGGIKNQHNPDNHGMDGIIAPSARVYEEYESGVLPFGTPASETLPPIMFDTTFRFGRNQSVYGFSFAAGEDLVGASLHFTVVDIANPDGESDFIYESYIHNVNVVSGGIIEWRFHQPLEVLALDTVAFWVKIHPNSANERFLLVRPSITGIYPFLSVALRIFEDKNILLEGDVLPCPIGDTEKLFADESRMHSLHLANTNLVLADKKGGMIIFNHDTDERGAVENNICIELGTNTLHDNRRFALADKDGSMLMFQTNENSYVPLKDRAPIIIWDIWQEKRQAADTVNISVTLPYIPHQVLVQFGVGDYTPLSYPTTRKLDSGTHEISFVYSDVPRESMLPDWEVSVRLKIVKSANDSTAFRTHSLHLLPKGAEEEKAFIVDTTRTFFVERAGDSCYMTHDYYWDTIGGGGSTAAYGYLEWIDDPFYVAIEESLYGRPLPHFTIVMEPIPVKDDDISHNRWLRINGRASVRITKVGSHSSYAVDVISTFDHTVVNHFTWDDIKGEYTNSTGGSIWTKAFLEEHDETLPVTHHSHKQNK